MIAFFVFVLWMIGTLFYMVVENIPFVDSLLYSAMIITTVGSHEFKLDTLAGKIFTMVYSFLSTTLFVGLIAGLAQAVIVKEHKKEEQ
ncbi:ion channel [Paenibacillus sp. TRM 82003]|nr:ion channel [Paenibacillus sp. TRM 82003]